MITIQPSQKVKDILAITPSVELGTVRELITYLKDYQRENGPDIKFHMMFDRFLDYLMTHASGVDVVGIVMDAIGTHGLKPNTNMLVNFTRFQEQYGAYIISSGMFNAKR